MIVFDEGIYNLLDEVNLYIYNLIKEHGPNYEPEVIIYLGQEEYRQVMHYASNNCYHSYDKTNAEILKDVMSNAEIIPVMKNNHLHITHVRKKDKCL